MTEPTCETCRFFDTSNEDAGSSFGLCRRYAPRPLTIFRYQQNEEYCTAEFAQMTRHDWCGEYQPRPGGTPDGR